MSQLNKTDFISANTKFQTGSTKYKIIAIDHLNQTIKIERIVDIITKICMGSYSSTLEDIITFKEFNQKTNIFFLN